MAEELKKESIEVPISLVAPARLGKDADEETGGLFFPHRTNLPVGLVVDWAGDQHLIHLEGPYAFEESAIGIGNPIRGVVIKTIEYRVDVTSCYNSSQEFDPAGALVLKGGELSICCRRLGDQFRDGPHRVPLGGGYLQGSAEEECGFTRWSIVVRQGDDVRVIRSFEALPREV